MASRESRVDWVDHAKGLCIVLVVMMHSVLGVEKATDTESWMGTIVAFAQPFRMPDFFMISGLFLARVIDRDWRDYADRKVVHFAYFYVLWVAINFALRGPGIVAAQGPAGLGEELLLAFVEPFGTMWFIYLLPLFFVTAKATRALPWPAVWLAAAALHLAPIHTGWTVPDEFGSRFVFFYSGYVFAPRIFALAAAAQRNVAVAIAGLLAWALANGWLTFAGHAGLPGVTLVLGFAGAVAVVAGSSLLAKVDWTSALRYCGRHSLVIYLAFVLFMAPIRQVLLRLDVIGDVGTVALIVTLSAVAGSIVLYWMVRGTPLRFLFERPPFARLQPNRGLVPAE